MKNRLNALGASVKTPAKLPALQGARVDDPQVQKALESIREWLEVRLGSRGDPYERAATVRDLQQGLAPLQEALDALGPFDGGIESLRATQLSALPALSRGAFAQVGDDLFYCNGKAWFKATLTAV